LNGTPTKRQVSKRQVSKCLVSKRLKRQVYKTSALQNVRFTKRQVYKTSGLQNVLLQKNIHLYSVLVGGGNPQVLLRHVCRQSDGCVLFSILKGFLPYMAVRHVTGTGSGLLGGIPRVVVQISALTLKGPL
jgi:hypothetical protein